MQRRSPAFLHALAVSRVRQRLLDHAFPRAQMTLISALTGGFGLLSSFALLQLGLDSMTVRYPLAVGCAYLFFLFLIWLWLRTNAADYAGAADLLPGSGSPGGGGTAAAPAFRSGAGGDFGGGGAAASFDAPAGVADAAVPAPADAGSPIGDALGAAADADEFAVPLAALALAAGLAVASFYVIYIAPLVFAEVLVDGALSYALFRYLRGRDPRHWLASAVRRTAVPFAATAVFVALLGAGLSAYAPGASSIGQVFGHAGATGPAR
ncbi:hypothetical protein [Pseudorhodoferax sp.]|uniref:hypothetical protein n=1 Tax=Pseudorhodoferax sp. TaxID=1993553 RepID=UPI0039E3D4B1